MASSDRFSEIKKRLDRVSPSFCLAKWLQVTIHLHNGHTHSCHHPDTHRVPLDELKINPSALHNTSFKKKQRQLMLDGQRPPECDYCWKIEDTPGGNISDRIIKSSDNWAQPHLEEIATKPADRDVNPQYLEVSFSHACNFKCSYCYPHLSSKWMEEIKKHGPYQLGHMKHNDLKALEAQGKIPIDLDQENPYVEAFWKWWPSLYPDLKVLRITGGEPLLSPNTFRMLDEIAKMPNPDLELAINSNLGAPQAVVDNFIAKYKKISDQRSLRGMRLYTSVDTWGTQAEYIRHGLKFENFWQNVEKVITEIPDLQLTLMCTFNNLSVPGFRELLNNLLEMKKKHCTYENRDSFLIDVSVLMNPRHQSVQLLPRDYLEKELAACASFIEDNMIDHEKRSIGFNDYEKIKFNRPRDYALSSRMSDEGEQMKNFYRFFTEHDRRRSTDFLAAFPELANFWHTCKLATESPTNQISY